MSKILNDERDKIMHERNAYEADKDAFERARADLEFNKSIIADEQLRLDEMEVELRQRSKMLNMF